MTPWVSEEVGYRLTQDGNLAVFDVTGDGPDEPGRVRIRVRGTDHTRSTHPRASISTRPAKQEVAEFDGAIGIALREPDGDCLFARVWHDVVEVWRPWTWTPPVVPAERVCSAAQAASGYSY